MLACGRRVVARPFAALPFFMRLRRARNEGCLNNEVILTDSAMTPAIDELGAPPLDPDGAQPLFQAFADERGRQSAVVVTNRKLNCWSAMFSDDQMAAVVIGRNVHYVRLVQLQRETYRVRNTLMQGKAIESGAQLSIRSRIRR